MKLTTRDVTVYERCVADLEAVTCNCDITSDLLSETLKLWKQGEPFYITGIVSAPYVGCLNEPQIWLVNPCSDDPCELVLPLYASGQGLGVDIIHSAGDLFVWLTEKDLMPICHSSDTYCSPRCKTSGLLSPYGRFRDFEVHSGDTPISELPVAEHFWALAARAASATWEYAVKWICPHCEQMIVGGEYESEPIFTSYHGNGGVGVIMTDVMCTDCVAAGTCDMCAEEGNDALDSYDPDISEYGWSLCTYHTERLLEDCVRLWNETELKDSALNTAYAGLSIPATVYLCQDSDAPMSDWIFKDESDAILPIKITDARTLQRRLHGASHYDEVSMLQLSGAAVENICDD